MGLSGCISSRTGPPDQELSSECYVNVRVAMTHVLAHKVRREIVPSLTESHHRVEGEDIGKLPTPLVPMRQFEKFPGDFLVGVRLGRVVFELSALSSLVVRINPGVLLVNGLVQEFPADPSSREERCNEPFKVDVTMVQLGRNWTCERDLVCLETECRIVGQLSSSLGRTTDLTLVLTRISRPDPPWLHPHVRLPPWFRLSDLAGGNNAATIARDPM